MKKEILYGVWAGLFVICVALSLLGESPVVKNIFGVLFFLPPVLLLLKGERKIVFWLSCCSLVLTVICLIAAALSTQTDGLALTVFTALVSAPMLCCTYWPESLFFWACLLYGSRTKLRR